MPDPYAHGHHESVLRSHRWRTAENSAAYLLPALAPGVSVLDVGAGPGTITLDLAERVAPGPVRGVDASADVVTQAEAARVASGLDNASFAVDDAYALDSADGAWDVVHAHQVLQHLVRPVDALREFRRVVAPDGVVAARDVDYEGGCSRLPMTARGGAACGPTVRCSRRSPTTRGATASETRRHSSGSARRGGNGPSTPTPGCCCRTARSSLAADGRHGARLSIAAMKASRSNANWAAPLLSTRASTRSRSAG